MSLLIRLFVFVLPILYQEDIAAIFSKADKNNSGVLDVHDFKEVVEHICERYPQVNIYLKRKKLKNFNDLLKGAQGNDKKKIDIEMFKKALSEVDSQMKNLPATAQVKLIVFFFDTFQPVLVFILVYIGCCSTR